MKFKMFFYVIRKMLQYMLKMQKTQFKTAWVFKYQINTFPKFQLGDRLQRKVRFFFFFQNCEFTDIF